jgi:hypothetical protein
VWALNAASPVNYSGHRHIRKYKSEWDLPRKQPGQDSRPISSHLRWNTCISYRLLTAPNLEYSGYDYWGTDGLLVWRPALLYTHTHTHTHTHTSSEEPTCQSPEGLGISHAKQITASDAREDEHILALRALRGLHTILSIHSCLLKPQSTAEDWSLFCCGWRETSRHIH